MKLSVREMKESDIASVVNYFINASPDYLLGMGAISKKLPPKKQWMDSIKQELYKPYEEKAIYYIIWQVDGKEIGHTNINKIEFGKEAHMHLHMWNHENRQKGKGLEFVKKSIPFYFKNFKLQQLICEPYALNPAPTKTILEVGFEFEKEYETIPGVICFRQKVKRYRLPKENWELRKAVSKFESSF